MKKRIILILLIFALSIGFVSASENTTETISDHSNDVELINSQNQDLIKDDVKYSDIYVNSSKEVNGDGLSPETAYKSLSYDTYTKLEDNGTIHLAEGHYEIPNERGNYIISGMGDNTVITSCWFQIATDTNDNKLITFTNLTFDIPLKREVYQTIWIVPQVSFEEVIEYCSISLDGTNFKFINCTFINSSIVSGQYLNSIDYQNQVINNETCVKCLRCLAPCPKGHIIRQKAAPKPQPDFSPTRRKLLIGAVVLGALAGAYKSGLKISQDIAKKVKRVIVPAGAKNYHDFANRCLNCNLCVNNCPMKIIKKANNEYPVVHLDYGKNFCKYDCNKCARVCPSGAIEHISLKQKQNTQIAMAVIDEEKCIECGLCVHTCPKGIIAKQEGEKPIIDASECIGCGACHSACPVEAITIYPVEQHRNL